MTDSNKFPTDFVPVSRLLVEELGYQAAYVFGIVWNYCQMETGMCKASHDTIADRAGMSRRSIITHLDELIKAGYIEDLTPTTRNEPHQLCTKKGVQKLHTKERTIKEEKPVEEPERYAKSAHQNNGGMQKLPSGYAKSAHLGMQNLHKNRHIEETVLIEGEPNQKKSPPPGNKKPATQDQLMFLKISELCQWEVKLMGDKQKGRVKNAKNSLLKFGTDPPQLDEFREWWYAYDWRGQKKQPPTPEQILEEWGRFEKSTEKPKVRMSAK